MKTFVVTGASQGIGREISKALARDGHQVVMLSRDPQRAAAALEQVRAVAKGQVDSLTGDLSLMSEARRLANEVQAKLSRLDALVLSASMIPQARTVTAEGLETALATNVLAPVVLTTALLPLLKSSAPSRVVTFYGGNERGMNVGDLQSAQGSPNGFTLYGRSKLVLSAVTITLAQRLAGSGVTVNSAWPGIVLTDTLRTFRGAMGVMMFLMRPLMRTPEQGAQTPLFLATAPELEQVSGKFYGTMFGDGRKEMPTPDIARDAAQAAQVYEACLKLAGVSP
jgi:NAD(P)-dependent dehydrogenase (short-subunit alcohol dehydrogenase family)